MLKCVVTVEVFLGGVFSQGGAVVGHLRKRSFTLRGEGFVVEAFGIAVALVQTTGSHDEGSHKRSQRVFNEHIHGGSFTMVGRGVIIPHVNSAKVIQEAKFITSVKPKGLVSA